MADKIFANGMIVKDRRNAPEYVLVKLSIKVDDFRKTLTQHEDNGWVNINILRGRSGKEYAEIDTWKPSGNRQGECSYPASSQRQYAPRQTPPPPPYPRQAAPPPPSPYPRQATPPPPKQPELEAESMDEIPFDDPPSQKPALITHVDPTADEVYPNRARGSNYCGD